MRTIISLLFLLAVISGCSSTKKAARKFSEIFKKEQAGKTDSAVNKNTDSAKVKQSSSTTIVIDSSGYEKEIEENTTELTITDTLGREIKKVVTKKVTKERGKKKVETTTEKLKSDSAHLKKAEATNLKKDTGSKIEAGRWEVTKDKQVERSFSGWAWLVGILFVILLIAYGGYRFINSKTSFFKKN